MVDGEFLDAVNFALGREDVGEENSAAIFRGKFAVL